MNIDLLFAGRIRITKYGPRIFWKKHLLNSMALGYGGCFIPEYIPETNVIKILSQIYIGCIS